MGIVESLDLLLDAIAFANQSLFPLPVPFLLHGVAVVVALAVFFRPVSGRGLNALVKIWLGISFALIALVLRAVVNFLELQSGQVNAVIFNGGALAYGLLGLMFLADIWMGKIDFSAGGERSSNLSWLGLLGVLSITVLYPLTQLAAGHQYPRMVVYGEEIPVLGYAVYLLIMAIPGTPRLLLALVSTLALLSGASGSIGLGYWSDLFGAVAGLLGLAVLGVWWREGRGAHGEDYAAARVRRVRKVPRIFWRLLRLPPRILYALGLGRLHGRFVLLLTTIGRKSGLPRVTPLQYEEVDGDIYIGSARGVKADWYRNILANPTVEVRVKSRQFRGHAEPIADPCQIADFLELRLKRHPKMVAAMLRAEGFPSKPNRQQLEAYAAERAMVIIHPLDED